MNKFIIGLFLGILLGLVAGYFITTRLFFESIPKGYVRVTINNNSGHKIKTLTLEHAKGSVKVIFKNEGENSYRIIAILDNDSILSSIPEYIEAGYFNTETILANKVITERNK